MITKRPVLESVIQRLGIQTTPEQLAKMVTVAPVNNTQLITVSVESTDPNFSAAVANAIVTIFSEQLEQTQSARFAESKASLKAQMDDAEKQVTDLRAQISASKNPSEIASLETRLNQYEQIYANMLSSFEQVRLAEAQSTSSVSQVERAVAVNKPVKPKTTQNTALAAVVGLMLSAGIIFAYDALDDTVKDPEEIVRKLRLPIMGAIAHFDEPKDGDLITRAQPRSPVAESFRALRTNVQYASVDAPIHTLLVTSPTPADGKTTIVANLAMVMAQGGREVAVLDADLHRPRVHRVLSAGHEPGLSNLFVQPQVYLDGTFQETPYERVHVVASGKLPPNPSELLGSNKMREILAAVQAQADLVLVDTPPVLSVTDAVVLAPVVDGVLLVIRPGETKLSAVKAAVEQLRYVGANLIGVVINEIDQRSGRYGYYYKDYYYQKYKYGGGSGKKAGKSEEKARPDKVVNVKE